MEAAPSAKPRREPPPIPPHYVSLRKLQELRLKEQEEKRRREEEAAAAAAAKREAEAAAAAAAAAIKRDAALKEAAKGRAVPWEAPGGAKERHRGGQGHQWVPSAHRAPAATPRPTPTCGEVAAVDRGRAVGGGRGKKGKGKASPCHTTVDEAGKLGEAAPASSNAGKPEDESKPRAKAEASVDQTAQSRSSGGLGEPAKAAAASSRHHFKRKGRKGAGGRGAETSAGDAPAKSAVPCPSPTGGVKSDNTGKPKPSAPRRAGSGTGSDSTDGKKAAAPAKAPPTSAADDSSKSAGDGELRETVEAKPQGLGEGQRQRPVVEVQAVAELTPRAVKKWAEPRRRDRGIEAAEQHGRVWVPKAAAATGSSAGAGL